jgi:DNA-binding NtrC family response regulator
VYSSTPHSWLTLPRPARERVLCVDDDVKVVLTVQRILAGRYDVSAIVGGAAALEAVRTSDSPFAAVIADIRMPDLSGIALLQCVRRIAPMTMRVLLTAYPDRDSVAAAAEHCDVYRVLVKPCPPDLLVSTVEGAVRRHCELRTAVDHESIASGRDGARD